MPDRILDFSEEAAHLAVRYSNLLIRRPEKPDVSVPLSEVAVVVAANPGVTCTLAVLSGVCAAGGTIIACDDKRLPVGMMLPLQGNFVQAERMAMQVAARHPLKKRLWQQVASCKVRGQAASLRDATGEDGGLDELAARIRSGDPENIEAQAARRYWTILFGEWQFRRDRDEPGINAALNYGYAVLRAMTARAICASGLHPSIGIHHHNRYSQFTLADDLMEPFRVVIDRCVLMLVRARGHDLRLDRSCKAEIIEAANGRFVLGGERRSLFEILGRVVASLVEVFAGTARKLSLPDFDEYFGTSLDEG